MEYKDPMHELLSSLEQIVFKDETQKITLTHRTTSCTEIEQLRKDRVIESSVIFVKNKFGCNENAQHRKKGGNNFPPKTLTLSICRLKTPPAHNSPV